MTRKLLMLICLCLTCWTAIAAAEEPLAKLPGHDNFQRVRDGVRGLGSDGRVSQIEWSEDGASMTFRRQNARSKINLNDFAIEAVSEPETPGTAGNGGSGGPRRDRPMRARTGRAEQSTWVRSPDGQWTARYRDYNVVLERVADSPEGDASDVPAGGANPRQGEPAPAGEEKKSPAAELVPVTTSGSAFFRYGTACWVYGEELFQDSAMWWSPDSRKLAFYEIDERHMPDYYLTRRQRRSVSQAPGGTLSEGRDAQSVLPGC